VEKWFLQAELLGNLLISGITPLGSEWRAVAITSLAMQGTLTTSPPTEKWPESTEFRPSLNTKAVFLRKSLPIAPVGKVKIH